MYKQSCYADAKDFTACVQGLNSAAAFLKVPGIFATADQAKSGDDPYIGDFIKNYGLINLYAYKPAPKGSKFSETWANYKKVRSLEIASYGNLFQQMGRFQSVPFSDVLDDLKTQTLANKGVSYEGIISASVLNAVFGSALDPHTRIEPAAEFNDESASGDEVLVGIGASLQKVGGQVIVAKPIPGYPAIKAGVRAHDVIVKINGVPVGDKDIDTISKEVRGAAGTTVTLTLLRNGKTFDISIVREQVVLPNVEAEVLNDGAESIGYIRLGNFTENQACDKIDLKIRSLENKGVKALILDLRGNPGGLLSQAQCVGALFVGRKVIVQQKDLKTGVMTPLNGTRDALTDLPMVTLINSGSASASEIVAGALQDYQRSWIAGERSFGKATVQAIIPWTKTIYFINTIARFYQPSGRTNQVVGILPDFDIDPVPNATEDEKFSLHEGDYYSNALPPLGKPWQQPRPQDVQKISACVNSYAHAQALYKARLNDAVAPDYQVLASEDLLNCAH